MKLDVGADQYSAQCSSSGPRNDATSGGCGQQYTLAVSSCSIMEKVAAILLFCKPIYHDLCIQYNCFAHTVLYLSSAQSEQTCGSIGNNNETAATASRAQIFYLDTDNPATCSGNISSWRVCYYGPDSIDNFGSYWATYAVYRRMGSGNRVRYERVSEMFRAIRTISLYTDADPIVDGEIARGGFNCYTDSIDVGNSPLTIQAGDIIGACIFDPEDQRLVTRLPLDACCW